MGELEGNGSERLTPAGCQVLRIPNLFGHEKARRGSFVTTETFVAPIGAHTINIEARDDFLCLFAAKKLPGADYASALE
jgi:hypothetical protein